MTRKGAARFSATAPPDLMEEFDATVSSLGLDRSKAIQLAMRDFIIEHTLSRKESGSAVGTITMIYDHEVPGLEASLTDLQHHYRRAIGSSMHLHLDQSKCLLVIALKGDLGAIRGLAQAVTAKRGVVQVKLSTVQS
jgi:CopG family nickel-responsive transcriptional regulator